MWKGRNEGGNNAYKIFMCRVEEENIIYKQSSLFGAAHRYNEKETIFWMDKKVNSLKSKRWDREVDSVKQEKKERKKNCEYLNSKNASFNNKRSSHIKRDQGK